MLLSIIICLILGGQLRVTSEPNHDSELWSIQKPGDIVLHAVFPLRDALWPSRDNLEPKYHFAGFNFEGIVWMDAMIRRVSEINQGRTLPGNITLGYSIHDSSNDPRYGRKQTLSFLNKIIIKGASEGAVPLHFPGVLGPASDRVQSGSDKLYEMFNLPRIFYTPTSSRFDTRKIIRTVPSDLLHVEVLLQFLEDTKCKEVSVVASRSEMWKNRVDAFQSNMKKRKTNVRDVVYVDTVSESAASSLQVDSQVVVVFAEANTTRIVIERAEKKQGRTWISVGQFDDPLLAVFDGFGQLLSKVIIRNSKRETSRDHRGYFPRRTLEKNNNGNFNKSVEWLHKVKKKYMQQCRSEQLQRIKLLGEKDEESLRKECSKKAFQDKIVSFFAQRNDHRSSLTLQGVEDAVNVIASSLHVVLRNCSKRLNGDALRSCLRFSKKNYWFDTLSKVNLRNKDKVFGLNQHRTLIGRYSIQVLRRIPTTENETYEKVREWIITDDLRSVRDANVNDAAKNSSTGSQSDGSCTRCDNTTTSPNCRSDATVIDWTRGLAIALYLLEIFTLLAVILSSLYFLKHKNSPIMILCYSWPDNVVLAVLALFCLLPMMHVGELSSQRCSALWPIVNVIFGFYSALLLTKTLFVQNLLKCEVATERPGRRAAFSVFVTTLLLVILVTFPVFGFPTLVRFSCPPRGVFVLCAVRGNIGVLASVAFNWFLLLALCVLAGLETVRERRNFCRTENLLGVAAAGLISYTCLIISAYMDLQLKHYLAVTFIRCVAYLVNPCICLAFIYLPTLRLVSTWLRQHIRQKRNLTSIKRAQVMSSKRQSAGPLNSLFGTGFSTEQSLLPLEQSGYYFNLRPTSEMSYPNSLVHGVHQPARGAFGHGRNGAISSQADCLSFQSGPSMDGLETLERTESVNSFYDNLSTVLPAEEVTSGPSPEELLREMSTFWESAEKTSGGAFCDENRNEDVALAVEETNEWPSLEGLRASDL